MLKLKCKFLWYLEKTEKTLEHEITFTLFKSNIAFLLHDFILANGSVVVAQALHSFDSLRFQLYIVLCQNNSSAYTFSCSLP